MNFTDIENQSSLAGMIQMQIEKVGGIDLSSIDDLVWFELFMRNLINL